MKLSHCIAVIRFDLTENSLSQKYAEQIAPLLESTVLCIYPNWKDASFWDNLMVKYNILFVVFEIGSSGFRLRKTLLYMRKLRVPYLAIPSTIKDVKVPTRFIVPIGVLPEEKEKGVYTSAMSTKLGTAVLLLTARGYGSRAKSNTDSIFRLLLKQKINVNIIQGKRNSENIDLEGLRYATGAQNMLWISASREYALDDWIFGCKEYRILKKCSIPVMLINPRGDLLAFCE